MTPIVSNFNLIKIEKEKGELEGNYLILVWEYAVKDILHIDVRIETPNKHSCRCFLLKHNTACDVHHARGDDKGTFGDVPASVCTDVYPL